MFFRVGVVWLDFCESKHNVRKRKKQNEISQQWLCRPAGATWDHMGTHGDKKLTLLEIQKTNSFAKHMCGKIKSKTWDWGGDVLSKL